MDDSTMNSVQQWMNSTMDDSTEGGTIHPIEDLDDSLSIHLLKR